MSLLLTLAALAAPPDGLPLIDPSTVTEAHVTLYAAHRPTPSDVVYVAEYAALGSAVIVNVEEVIDANGVPGQRVTIEVRADEYEGQSATFAAADINRDGAVGSADLAALLAAWSE